MESLNNNKVISLGEDFGTLGSLSGFPANTAAFVRMDKIIKQGSVKENAVRLSHHLVKCASVIPVGEFIGWQMYVPKKGLVEMTLFGSESFEKKDLEWLLENTAKTSGTMRRKKDPETFGELYEFYLPIAEVSSSTIGFNGEKAKCDDNFTKWPTAYPSQFAELTETLRQSGAVFRAVVGAATSEEQEACRKNTVRSLDSDRVDAVAYVGKPVRTRFLFRLNEKPTVRLNSVLEEMIPGSKLRRLGSMNNPKVKNIWNYPLINANVLPDYAVRIMLLEPELKEAVVGIEVCEKKAKNIPMSHKNSKTKASLVIGKAEDVTGIKKTVKLAENDIKRHYQIIGQTGCGKSTLLTSLILSAIENGYGLTFLDPHGSTIDTVLRCVPEKYAQKIRVVRIGDAENPVPLNLWDSEDPSKEERTISDLVELFTDIFDPNREGFVGPRWERWFSTFAKASIALFGKRASLESIAVISQSKENMRKVSKAILSKEPELAEIIKQEFALDGSSDFHSTLAWFLCKLQRLTSVEQLRKTIGGGANALDLKNSIDTDAVTLIDLASPGIGTNASRTIGTLILMKLWNAAITRKHREKTHLVVIDEASLFMTNPLPRMLAEGRKFGISCVISHQYATQMSRDIRDSLESNSANFTAFRLSPKDAANAAIRFDDPEILPYLTRLDAFNGITTLSVDGCQTAPFTMRTIRPKYRKNAEEIAERIEEASMDALVEPYRCLRALTAKEIQLLLDTKGGDRGGGYPKKDDITHKKCDDDEDGSKLFGDWEEFKRDNEI